MKKTLTQVLSKNVKVDGDECLHHCLYDSYYGLKCDLFQKWRKPRSKRLKQCKEHFK